MDQDDLISTLNTLVETSRDGEEGFRNSADHANDAQLKSLFQNRAESCAAAVRELEQIVMAHGGKPSESSTVSGTLHRRWIDIKSMITGRDDHAILDEAERGEDVAVAGYRKALTQGLPDDVQALVERQYQGVLRNHDQIKQLRNQMRASS